MLPPELFMNKDDPETVQKLKSELEINRSKQTQVNKIPIGPATKDICKTKKSDIDTAVGRLEEKIRDAEKK
jgi:hypothetical protein